MRVGSQDILLPTTMVGNYPNPRWYDGSAFAQYPKGEFVYDAISREAFEDAVAAIVHDQVGAGIDVISDGRVYGGDSPYGQILYHYVERMAGYKLSGPPIGLPIYSTLFSPTCVGEVRREHPFHLATLRAVRKATTKPVKISYTGIQVLAAATTNQYYKETRELALAIAKAFNEDFKELADNGVDIIQLDEFTWHFGLSLGDWEVDVFNAAVDGVDGDIHVHVCWGNYLGTPGYLPSGPAHGEAPDKEGTEYVLSLRERDATTARARAIFPRVHRVHISALNYEIAHKGAGDLVALEKGGWEKDFIAGVIDVKSVEVETAEGVADRIRACLDVVRPENLGLSTDCGLINLPRRVAQAKLRSLVEGANIVRGEILAGTTEDAPEPVSV